MKLSLIGPGQPLTPVLAPILVLLVLGATLALPKPDRDSDIRRPPHHVVVAALHQGTLRTVTGRIISVKPAGFVLRVLMGTRKVAAIHRTSYTGSRGASLNPEMLRHGDSVQVDGYLANGTLLALRVHDLSRR